MPCSCLPPASAWLRLPTAAHAWRWAAALKEKSMRIIRWIACVSMLSALLMLHYSSTAA
jgi:hypothetical protein